jgi:hypothetical protein
LPSNTKRSLRRGRARQAVGAAVLAFISVAVQMVALAALSSTALAQHASRSKPLMASALLSGIACGGASATSRPACQPAGAAGASAPVATRLVEHVEVPSGGSQCPESGTGAACSSRPPVPESGTPAVPLGLVPCPSVAKKAALGAPGACTPESAQPIPPAPHGAATATQTAPDGQLTLTADQNLLGYGGTIKLDARSTFSVGQTPWAIEIFDRTKLSLVAACPQSSDCVVLYTGKTGLHDFIAYVTTPTASLPTDGIQLTSNAVDVRWLGIGLLAGNPRVVPPGKPVTFTAYASEEVSQIGYQIELRDSISRTLLTYCTHGTTCSTSLVEPTGGTHEVIAALKPLPTSGQTVATYSGPVSGVWLAVELAARSSGGVVSLTATANADLASSPWSLFVYSASGQLLGAPCSATSCTVTTPAAGDGAAYYATIETRGGAPQVNGPLGSVLNRVAAIRNSPEVVARSPLIHSPRLIWGVDSCKAFTQDPSGSTGLYPQVAGSLGAPDFWGRYLTTTYNCPGISAAEVAAAHARNMGILPIYDDYDCGALTGYGTGRSYAAGAAAAAVALGIPAGTGLVLDIEPPGPYCPGASFVDSSFLEAWYDGVTAAGYVPVYYGNTTAGSPFANGWCGAVAAHPEYATTAYLWSFEPSLLGSYSKRTAPGFSPNGIGCAGDTAAWQYQLSAGSMPDVDSDLLLTRIPLWYP